MSQVELSSEELLWRNKSFHGRCITMQSVFSRVRSMIVCVICALCAPIAPPIFASPSENPCLTVEDRFFGKCPLPVDARDAKEVLRAIAKGGQRCVGAVSAGSDEFGGRYVQCKIGTNRIVIRAYPSSGAFKQARYRLSMTRWGHAELKKLKGVDCAAVFLESFRYRVELWSSGRSLMFAKHGDVVSKLKDALRIPSHYVTEKKSGLKAGMQYLSLSETGCSDLVGNF